MLFRLYYCIERWLCNKRGVKDQVIDRHILNRLYDMSVAIEEIRGQKFVFILIMMTYFLKYSNHKIYSGRVLMT